MNATSKIRIALFLFSAFGLLGNNELSAAEGQVTAKEFTVKVTKQASDGAYQDQERKVKVQDTKIEIPKGESTTTGTEIGNRISTNPMSSTSHQSCIWCAVILPTRPNA